MKTTYPKQTTQKCNRCGSFLLLVDQKTEMVEGQHGPVTTSSYACSDKTCQKEFDKELSKMMEQHEEKKLAKEKRIEKMKVNRKITLDKKRAAK